MRWRVLLTQRHSRSLWRLHIGAGFGMLAMILHAAFDFNFHIPANAIAFAFLSGVFWFTQDGGRA